MVYKSSSTFDGWAEQENLPKGWKAATSKMGEYKAALQETDAIFTWNFTEWFDEVKKEEVVSINAKIRTVDCIPDTKPVELGSSDTDEADAIKAATKDPNLGIVGIINYTTKGLDDKDGKVSKEVIDDAARALKPTEKEERSQNCGSCETVSAKNKNLKNHVGSHTEKRPFSCEVCGEIFSKCELTEHGRLHVVHEELDQECDLKTKDAGTVNAEPYDEAEGDEDLKMVGMNPSIKDEPRELFEFGQDSTVRNITPEGWEADVTLPQGRKVIPNVRTKPMDCDLCGTIIENDATDDKSPSTVASPNDHANTKVDDIKEITRKHTGEKPYQVVFVLRSLYKLVHWLFT